MNKKVFAIRDHEALFGELCSVFSETATDAVKSRGRFCLALSGGKTPKALYETLSTSHTDSVDWSRTFIFWGDERFVPKNHPESNYRM